MTIQLEKDLDHLRRDLLAMASAVEGAVHKAVRALQHHNPTLAKEVIDGDDDIDDHRSRIEEEFLTVLALRQPVAQDLRRVVAARMVSVDLERIGDLAEVIADRALQLGETPKLAVPRQFRPMTERAVTMVRESLDAFMRQDARQARAVCRQDDEVDRFCAEIIAELAAAMKAGGPDAVEPGVALFSAARALERIADHATNVAENVVYLAEGEIIRHRPETWGEK